VGGGGRDGINISQMYLHFTYLVDEKLFCNANNFLVQLMGIPCYALLNLRDDGRAAIYIRLNVKELTIHFLTECKCNFQPFYCFFFTPIKTIYEGLLFVYFYP